MTTNNKHKYMILEKVNVTKNKHKPLIWGNVKIGQMSLVSFFNASHVPEV
jgi:hypothetical protein